MKEACPKSNDYNVLLKENQLSKDIDFPGYLEIFNRYTMLCWALRYQYNICIQELEQKW